MSMSVVVSILFAQLLNPQPQPQPQGQNDRVEKKLNPIQGLFACEGDLSTGRIMAGFDSGFLKLGQTQNAAGPYFEKAKQCFESGISTALDFAGESADLKEAIKDYYVEAMAHLEVMRRLEFGKREYEFKVAREKGKLEPSKQRVLLEAKLVGLVE